MLFFRIQKILVRKLDMLVLREKLASSLQLKQYKHLWDQSFQQCHLITKQCFSDFAQYLHENESTTPVLAILDKMR